MITEHFIHYESERKSWWYINTMQIQREVLFIYLFTYLLSLFTVGSQFINKFK